MKDDGFFSCIVGTASAWSALFVVMFAASYFSFDESKITSGRAFELDKKIYKCGEVENEK